jgi:hypothetical protein
MSPTPPHFASQTIYDERISEVRPSSQREKETVPGICDEKQELRRETGMDGRRQVTILIFRSLTGGESSNSDRLMPDQRTVALSTGVGPTSDTCRTAETVDDPGHAHSGFQGKSDVPSITTPSSSTGVLAAGSDKGSFE